MHDLLESGRHSGKKTVSSDATFRLGASNAAEERGGERPKGAVDCCVLHERSEHVAEWARTTLLIRTGHCRNDDSDNPSQLAFVFILARLADAR